MHLKTVLTLHSLLALLLLFLLPAGAKADVMYCYQGKDFARVIGVYKTTDSVDGCLSLNATLPNDSPLTSYNLVSMEFFDGEQEINLLDATGFHAFLSTSGGLITSWDIDIQGAHGSISTEANIMIPPDTDDIGEMGANDVGEIAEHFGFWTVSPEPASIVSLATVLAVVAMVVRKKALTIC